MEGKKKQSKPERQPLKTLHISWREKLKESCYRRVKEDRTRLLWNSRSPLHQSSTQKWQNIFMLPSYSTQTTWDMLNKEKGSDVSCMVFMDGVSYEMLKLEFIQSAFKDIVSDELKKIKNQHSDTSELPSSLSGEDDILWEYDGLRTAGEGEGEGEGECEEILLEMQRIFYEDIELELSQKEAERSIVLEDEEDEYLAFAVTQYMQLNDGKAWKEQIWCPICKKGELQENHHLIYCNLCQFKLNRGDQVDLSLLKDRLAETLEEHLDRGCRSKPEFCLETVFDLTALYIQCQHCDTFEVVI